MEIVIAAVGRLKGGPELDLIRTYTERLAWSVTVKEIDVRTGNGDARRRAEAEKLRAAIPVGAKTVALDERGKDYGSEDFAALIGRWRDDGTRSIGFLIGGADGLDPGLRNDADVRLNFGSLTWPHMLVRAMLAEQLYRAYTILSGHPYHRSG